MPSGYTARHQGYRFHTLFRIPCKKRIQKLIAAVYVRIKSNRISFEDFLKEEGIFEETTTQAVKRVLSWQICKP